MLTDFVTLGWRRVGNVPQGDYPVSYNPGCSCRSIEIEIQDGNQLVALEEPLCKEANDMLNTVH